ncbi:MAG: DUF6994 family protein, partial [Segetibacter sp.]
TLRSYHKKLWSKDLPNGKVFLLDDSTKNTYLHHNSDLGEFFLSSDSVIPTFTMWKRLAPILDQISQNDIDYFLHLAYTMGGMMIFPANRVGGKATINGARGFSRKICDRLDLTLECIRLYYIKQPSPLYATLILYHNFFELFETFQGYIDFFLLQDLVSDDYSSVKFLASFDNFTTSAVPTSLSDYVSYRSNTLNFINSRNKRIQEYSR